ncbi:MAG: DUF5688 family protein [Lachnospiraceae bacterium]|nr:DUF5688 family protein [Lachnospiraceae bacterium]
MRTAENRNTETMDFGAFTAAVKGMLREKYDGYRITVSTVDKNNGLRLTGVSISAPGQAVAPHIYLDGFYKDYLAGCPMGKVISGIAGLYEQNRVTESLTLPNVADFEAVKDLICFKLTNRERNARKLAAMPHRAFLDLAVSYYIPVTVPRGRSGRIAVTDQIFRMWKTDEEALYRHALENTRRLLPIKMRPLEEVVAEILTEGNGGISLQADRILGVPMYVLACGEKEESSAAAMHYGDVLREFAGRHGDFYILPSSIYETLLVPVSGRWMDADCICSMVREVNRTQVSPEEVLSDSAYLCHADTGAVDVLS